MKRNFITCFVPGVCFGVGSVSVCQGYIRAETNVDSAQVDQTFTVGNLFEGHNTTVAVARDNDGLIGISVPLRITLPTGNGPE